MLDIVSHSLISSSSFALKHRNGKDETRAQSFVSWLMIEELLMMQSTRDDISGN